MATRMLRQEYGYDVDKASRETGLRCDDPSLTQQNQKEDADINVIVRRFGVTGTVPSIDLPPMFGDFSELVYDYQSALNLIREADESFMSLEADVRSRFQNDPHIFVQFCSEVDAEGKLKNLEEMRKMGLAVPAKVVETPVTAKEPVKE